VTIIVIVVIRLLFIWKQHCRKKNRTTIEKKKHSRLHFAKVIRRLPSASPAALSGPNVPWFFFGHDWA
jgi:hypothetical protein